MMRRLTQVIAALAIVTGLSVATAGTAMAADVGEWACDYDDYHNSCLYITNLGDNIARRRRRRRRNHCEGAPAHAASGR
jgi:hypothetical protein